MRKNEDESMAEIVAGVVKDQGKYLLIRKGKGPFKGMWSVPSGRVQGGESYETALRREMREETNLDVVPKKEILSTPGHLDPAVTIHYFSCEAKDLSKAKPGSDAADLKWELESPQPAEAGFFLLDYC